MSTNLSFLSELEDIIQARIDNPADESYTSQLIASGEKRVAQKIGEEAVELALASVAGNAQEQLEEAADLVYHLLVLLKSKQLSLQDVSEMLRQRHEARTAR
jgi:phosphoribosyl-ATP pyrophosphohydrolase/phosphoribosyl-AMP cyclohydrolase